MASEAPTNAGPDTKRAAAREVVDILHSMSQLLDTKLSRQQLSYCISLIENGVNPSALADVIKELRARYPERGGGAVEGARKDGEEK